MTPNSAQTAEQGKSVQYSVSGLNNDTTYTVELFNCDNVSTDANGQTTFTQTKEPTATTDGSGVAAQGDTNHNSISVVNGGATTGTPSKVTIKPSNGGITFTVKNADSNANTSCVVPVVYKDSSTTGTSGALDTNKKTGAPTEEFGTGGEATFSAPAAASTNNSGVISVVSVDKAANTFVGSVTSGGTTTYAVYSYDSNDRYSDKDNGPISMATFESEVSRGDEVVALPYASDSSLSSNFIINNQSPAAPQNVTAAQSGTVVNVGWDKVTNADSYNVYRATVASANTPCNTLAKSDYAKIGTATTNSYKDSTVAVPTDSSSNFYCYAVTAVSDGEEGARGTTTDPTTVKKPDADTQSPTLVDSRVAADNGFAKTADNGDVWTLTFNEPMAAPAAGATLRVSDTDGTVADVVNGQNATFALNSAPQTVGGQSYPAGDVLTVTLTGAPTAVTSPTNSTAGIQYPATIQNTSGVTDAAGNRVDLSSGDKVVDPEPAISTSGVNPTNVQGTADDFTATIKSPSDAAAVPHALVDFVISNASGALTANDVTLQYNAGTAQTPNWQTIPLTVKNGTLTGSFGPAGGFNVPAGYNASTPLQVTFNKAGAYTATSQLVNVDNANQVLSTATDTTTVP